MSEVGSQAAEPRPGVLELYDEALPAVYGYLLSRCRDRAVAEDLTAETFLAAVKAGDEAGLSVGWLIGVARHKLIDHWKRRSREERVLRSVWSGDDQVHDPWTVDLDVERAQQVLAQLGSHHRAALTLRYFDGLSVPQVADHLGRSVHATEALLVRARTAFRKRYAAVEEADLDD